MKKSFYWMAMLLLFVACQKDDEPSIDKTDPDTNEEYRVSEKEAVSRAVKAIESIEEETSSRASIERRLKQVQRVRNSALTRNAEEIEELFYLVNFADEQGYALVAADERMTDVYMMAEKGNLDLEEVDPQSGLAFFLDRAVVYAHGELIPNDSLRIPPVDDDGDDEMVDRDDTISCLLPEEYMGRWYHVYRRYHTISNNALLSTCWHQSNPYNNNCPIMANGFKASAGCVAIAMAQIMAYHRYPTAAFGHSYNWDAMLASSAIYPSNNEAATSVANLVRDIGTSVNMRYGVTEQGASEASPSSVANGFRQFGYSADNLSNYSFNVVKGNINTARPVFVGAYNATGEGHAWVIDAYTYEQCEALYYSVETKEYCFTLNEGSRNEMVSCNWGWGSSSDFVLSGVFAYSFNVSPKMVKNIQPNIQL